MTESKWTANLLKKLRAELPAADIHKVNERIQGGRPDCHIILNGRHTDVEFKGPKTPISPLQRRTIDKMRRAGAVVLVVRFLGKGTTHQIEETGHLTTSNYVQDLAAYLVFERQRMPL